LHTGTFSEKFLQEYFIAVSLGDLRPDTFSERLWREPPIAVSLGDLHRVTFSEKFLQEYFIAVSLGDLRPDTCSERLWREHQIAVSLCVGVSSRRLGVDLAAIEFLASVFEHTLFNTIDDA